MLAGCPLGVGVDCDFEHVVGLEGEVGPVPEAMLEVCSALGVEPGQGIEYGSGNEVIPRREDVVAVEEEEDNEDEGGEEMGRLEELVVALPTAIVLDHSRRVTVITQGCSERYIP